MAPRKAREPKKAATSSTEKEKKNPWVLRSCLVGALLALISAGVEWSQRTSPGPGRELPSIGADLGARSADPRADSALYVLLECAAKCASLDGTGREFVQGLYKKMVQQLTQSSTVWGLRVPPEVDDGKWLADASESYTCLHTRCATGEWKPIKSGGKVLDTPQAPKEMRTAVARRGVGLLTCANKCANASRLTVDVGLIGPSNVAATAANILEECGIVHLWDSSAGRIGMWESSQWQEVSSAVDSLRSGSWRGHIGKKLTREQGLRGGRKELFLPAELASKLLDGPAMAVVVAVLRHYLQTDAFAVDYASVIEAVTGKSSAPQQLHPDVQYLPRTSISVHTAMADVPLESGPTFFCPCTHFASDEALQSPSHSDHKAATFAVAALRKATGDKGSTTKEVCLAHGYARPITPAGMITIYDGSLYHGGLANKGQKDRLVLNMNFMRPVGYEVWRNYTEPDGPAVNAEVSKFRKAVLPSDLVKKAQGFI